MNILKIILKNLKINNLIFTTSKIFKKKYVLKSSEESIKELNKYSKNNNYTAYYENTNVNKKEYDLDIIIPAYNVEKYINKCIDSILTQKTKYNYRIIVIDDGSSDKTYEILKSYNNNKLVVIRQENKGISISRNKGLDIINSRYVMFVDSDDYLEEDSIDYLLDLAIKNNYDIVEGAYQEVNSDNKIIRKVQRIESNNKNDLLGFPCLKIIKSDIFNNVRFPNYLFEDSIMRQIIYEKVNKVFIVNKCIYNYRQYNNQSLHHQKKNYRMLESLYITINLYNDRKKYDLKNTQEYYEYILKMSILIYSRIRYLDFELQKDFFSVYSNFVKDEFTNFETIDKEKKDLEKSIRNLDFDLFLKYCKYKKMILNGGRK